MAEAYRVRRNFQWDGWTYAPKGDGGACKCVCRERGDPCTGLVGKGCRCHDTACHCDCGIPEDQYGGDIWIVQEGHERKHWMIDRRYATYDSSLPPIDELLKDPEYKRLLEPYRPRRRQRVAA